MMILNIAREVLNVETPPANEDDPVAQLHPEVLNRSEEILVNGPHYCVIISPIIIIITLYVIMWRQVLLPLELLMMVERSSNRTYIILGK